MPQDFDGVRLTNGGPVTFLPPDGWAWFHIDNGPVGRPLGRLRISHGNFPGQGELVSVLQDGRVGIGLADPRTSLHVLGRISTGRDFSSAGSITFFPPDGFAWFHIDNGPAGGRRLGRLRISHGNNPGDIEIMTVTQQGNVGIGAPDPRERLDVRGNIVVSGDVRLTGADCAEEFQASSDEEVEPGTVMVIDETGALEPSARAYDQRVAGVVSGAGDFRPGIVLDRRESSRGRVQIALLGKTYVKVDATEHAVTAGDLLTTSDVRGHAMKVDDASKAFGAVLGKALQSLPTGRGLIPTLVSLR
jgi:hypothetical protein